VREVLGDRPWQKQIEILEAIRDSREVNVRSCHSAGKSWVASRAALWFLMNHPDSLVITTAPTARQVRGILWKEIGAAYHAARVPLGGDLTTTALRLGPAWLALGFTAAEHDPDRFQGFHAASTLVIVDEACGVSAEIDNAVDSILSGEHSRLLRIGNPTNIATPFGLAFRQQRGQRFAISAFDTPNFVELGITLDDIRNDTWRPKLEAVDQLPAASLINPEWVADKWRQWGETSPIFQARILAEFPTDGETMLLSLAAIEEATRREPSKAAGPKVFGVDVARHGSDETVVVLRDGDSVQVVDAWTGKDTMATVGRVVTLAAKYSPTAINVDEIGLGAGVLDRLVELGHPARGINVAKAPRDRDRFENLRAELFWNVREEIEAGALSVADDPLLVEQLAAIRYEFTSRGRIRLEAKANMRTSPDRADAVALALSPSPADLAGTIDIPTAGLRASPWQV
jgi:phage terminase large subunit